jgi:hypothetical protein
MTHRVRALSMKETSSKACKSSPVIPEKISPDHLVRYRNHHNAGLGSSAAPLRNSSYSELEYALGPPSSSSSAAGASSSFSSVSTPAPSLQSSATRPPSSEFPSTLSSNLAGRSQISTSKFRTNLHQNSSPTSGTASSSMLPQPPPPAGAPRESILVEYSAANLGNPTSRMGGTPLVASRGAFPPSSSSELPGYIHRLMSGSMANEYEAAPTRLPRTSSPSSAPPSLSDPMSSSRPNTLAPPSSWSIPVSSSTTLPAVSIPSSGALPSSPSSELAGYIRRVMFGFMPEYKAPPSTRFHETSTSTASSPSLPQPPPSHSGAPWQSAPADHPAENQENRMPWVGDGPPPQVASNGAFLPSSSSKLVSDIPVSASGFAANGYQNYSQPGSSGTSSSSSSLPPPSLSDPIFPSWPNVLSPSSLSNIPSTSSSALPAVSNASSGAIPSSSSSELAGDTQRSTSGFATDIYHDSPIRFPGSSSSSWPPPPPPFAGAPWEPALMDYSARNQQEPTSWVGGDPTASSGAFPPLTSFEPAGQTRRSISGFVANGYQASPPWLPETTPTTSSLSSLPPPQPSLPGTMSSWPNALPSSSTSNTMLPDPANYAPTSTSGRFPGTTSSLWPPPPPLAGAPRESALMDYSAVNQQDPTSWVVGGDPTASSGAFPPLTSVEPAVHTRISASGFMANGYQASPPWLPETTPSSSSSLPRPQPSLPGTMSSWPDALSSSSTSNTMLPDPANYAPTSASTSRYTRATNGGYSPDISSYTCLLPPPPPIANFIARSPSCSNKLASAQFQDTWTTKLNRTEDSAAPGVPPRARNEEAPELQPAQQYGSADIADVYSPSASSDGGASPPTASSSLLSSPPPASSSSSSSLSPHAAAPTGSSSSSVPTELPEIHALLLWLVRNISPAAFRWLISHLFLVLPRSTAANIQMVRDAAQIHGIALEDADEFLERAFRGASKGKARMD